jgi:hypothetical protein
LKRLIVATSLFAIVAAPAFAVEIRPPYEELNVERTLPPIAETSAAPYVPGRSAPFEQLTIDRALPVLPQRAPVAQSAEGSSLSGTRANVGVAGAEVVAVSPWIHDYSFIAPAL